MPFTHAFKHIVAQHGNENFQAILRARYLFSGVKNRGSSLLLISISSTIQLPTGNLSYPQVHPLS